MFPEDEKEFESFVVGRRPGNVTTAQDGCETGGKTVPSTGTKEVRRRGHSIPVVGG